MSTEFKVEVVAAQRPRPGELEDLAETPAHLDELRREFDDASQVSLALTAIALLDGDEVCRTTDQVIVDVPRLHRQHTQSTTPYANDPNVVRACQDAYDTTLWPMLARTLETGGFTGLSSVPPAEVAYVFVDTAI